MWQNKGMRAYSYDLRQRILRAVDQGMPRAKIIQTFAVSRSTIKRYLKLRRETDDVKLKAIPGRPSKKGAALHAGLLPQLEAQPDATMSRAIRRLNWTRKKKTIRASEQVAISPREVLQMLIRVICGELQLRRGGPWLMRFFISSTPPFVLGVAHTASNHQVTPT